jgi:inner membrane protein
METRSGAGQQDEYPPLQPKQPKQYQKLTFWEANRIILKGMLIGILTLVMLIPAAYITNLVEERAERQQEVIKEVSSKWAEAQTIVGPVLMVPYREYVTQQDGKILSYKRKAYFLPEQLSINGKLLPETRHRSLYDVTLYRSDITLSGSFTAPAIEALQIAPENVLWQEARLLIGLNDARGLEDEVTLQWNDTSLTFDPGVPENETLKTGMQTAVTIAAGMPATFTLNLKLKGSEYLYFTPTGKSTQVTLQSPWKNPAFDGKYLPGNAADISDNGFTAQWKILQASRPYPQYWANQGQELSASAFGVRLLQPTDGYVKTERSVKYALLFISLTFAVFFFIEILQKRQIHPLQYLLVGFALTIFYSLLLSFSEYIGFNAAYAIASSATITLIGLYVWSMFKKGKIAIGFTIALISLYAYIFFLIQLQDYALLFGSIGLFTILALAMYSSRKIDWYRTGNKTGDT